MDYWLFPKEDFSTPLGVIQKGLTTHGKPFIDFFSNSTEQTTLFNGDTALTFIIANSFDFRFQLVELIKKFENPDYSYLINIPNDYGETPLHVAAIYNLENIVKALLENKNIDLNFKDHRNLTAMDISILMDYQKISDLLKTNKGAVINDIKPNIFQWGHIFTSNLKFEIKGNQTPLLFNDQLCSPIQTSYGQNFSLTLTDTGNVYSAGLCSYGKTGHSKKRDILIPTMITTISEKRIKAIACGKDHSLLLDDIGCVYSFGNTSMGRLGIDFGFRNDAQGIPHVPPYLSQPTIIAAFQNNMKTIACGLDSSYAISSDGQVYSWGSNINSKLGYNTPQALSQATPKKIEELWAKMEQVACSSWHTVLLDEHGKVYTFGSNIDGRLGRSIASKESSKPGLVNLDQKITKICCGSNFTTVLTINGQLYSWGSNNRGQLGIPPLTGITTFSEQPILVKKLLAYSIHSFALGKQHCIALSDQGEVYCYGDNNYSQCGIGDIIDLDINLTRINTQGVFKVSAGGDNSMLSISTEHHSFGEALYSNFKSGLFSDIKIIANGEKSQYLTAHKVVLAARSKKLDKLLRKQLEDLSTPQSIQLSITKTINSFVEIDSIDGSSTIYIDFPVSNIETLSTFFKYIYSDHTSLTSNIVELGELAFALDIPRLAYLCNFKETKSLTNIPKSTLLGDFEILKDEEFKSIYSDIIFKCISPDEASSGNLNSYKLLAYLNSSYFKTMLSGSFIEKDKKEIQLFETSKSGLNSLLNYCYCEEVPEDINECIDMIIVCDQHQMLRAKDLCASKIRTQIDNDSLCYIYYVSIIYSVNPLKLWCSSKFSTMTEPVSSLYYFDQLPQEIRNEILLINSSKKINFDNKPNTNNTNNNNTNNNNTNNNNTNNNTNNKNNNDKKKFYFF